MQRDGAEIGEEAAYKGGSKAYSHFDAIMPLLIGSQTKFAQPSEPI